MISPAKPTNESVGISKLIAASPAVEIPGTHEQRLAKAKDELKPAASVIIVNCRQADLAISCVESLLRDHQRPRMEIIILDNSCDLDQAAMLTRLAQTRSEICLTVNPESMSLVHARNQGLARARGDYLVLLNPDTLVAPGWFTGLRLLLEAHPEFGLVSPLTNRAEHYGALASVDGICGVTQETIHQAQEITKALKGRWLELPSLDFFCVMGPRGVFSQAGLMDEGYEVGGLEVGGYEDYDYCKRVAALGYKLAVSLGSFVYCHRHERDFPQLPSEVRLEIVQDNERYFVSNWGAYSNPLELPFFFQALRQSLDILAQELPKKKRKVVDLPLSILKQGELAIPREYTKISGLEANRSGVVAQLRLLQQELNRSQENLQALSSQLAPLPDLMSALTTSPVFKANMFTSLCLRQAKGDSPLRLGEFCAAVGNFARGRKGPMRELLDTDPIMHCKREISYLLARSSQDKQIALPGLTSSEKNTISTVLPDATSHPNKRAAGHEPVRVAYFTNQLLDLVGQRPRYGGGERYCMALTNLLESLGIKVDLYQMGQHAFEGVYEGKLVKAIPMGQKQFSEFNLGAAEAFFKLSLHYDHVIYNLPELSAGTMRDDAINICHGIWFDHNNYGLNIKFRQPEWFDHLQRAFASPCLTVSVDTNSINVIRSLWPDLALKMRYIPNFVDTESFNPNGRPKDASPIRVLFPRRSQVNRGSRILDNILRAIPHDLRFFWVGEGDGPDTRIIQQLARSDRRLEFHTASFDEMPDWYRSCEICVIPTVACEGTSLSLLEGLASGCAVVTTNVGGLTDLVQDEVNGLVTDAVPDQIAAAITRLVEDVELRKRLQKEGVASAGRFSAELWREKWLKVLKDLGWV